MRYLRQLFVCSVLSALTIPVGCGPEAPDVAEQVSDVGSISLALVGTSATGATYRLSQAWFNLYGPTHRLVHGDGDRAVLTEVLPVGHYDVYLEPGWILERWTGGGYQQVEAALTSPNPTPVSIYEGAASTVVFQFRSDGDVISVGQGTLDIAIGVDDTPALSEDTDVACSNGREDTDVACSNWREDNDAACSMPVCVPYPENTDVACSNGYWQPYCQPVREDNDAACSMTGTGTRTAAIRSARAARLHGVGREHRRGVQQRLRRSRIAAIRTASGCPSARRRPSSSRASMTETS
ncbi:hypothetical protein BE20_40480 [Sorangium cellulosum]|nr:hypothetical protein BE20_40480 [Sorangium cellulosum]